MNEKTPSPTSLKLILLVSFSAIWSPLIRGWLLLADAVSGLSDKLSFMLAVMLLLVLLPLFVLLLLLLLVLLLLLLVLPLEPDAVLEVFITT
jgi:hypothetical protein